MVGHLIMGVGLRSYYYPYLLRRGRGPAALALQQEPVKDGCPRVPVPVAPQPPAPAPAPTTMRLLVRQRPAPALGRRLPVQKGEGRGRHAE